MCGTDRQSGDRHTVEHQIGAAVQQNAVLEGSRLAFVGIAHHIAHRVIGTAWRIACRGPFDRRGKTGTATPAQAGQRHFRQHRFGTARNCRAHRRTGQPVAAKQDVTAADIVFNQEIPGRPFVESYPGTHQLADAVDSFGRHLRHGPPIDQQCRPLIAQAGA